MLRQKKKLQYLLQPQPINILARQRQTYSYESYSKKKLRQQQFQKKKASFHSCYNHLQKLQAKRNASEHLNADTTEWQSLSDFKYFGNFQVKKIASSEKRQKTGKHYRGDSVQYEIVSFEQSDDISPKFSNSMISQKISEKLRCNKQRRRRAIKYNKQNNCRQLKKKKLDYRFNIGSKHKSTFQQFCEERK